jgi:hypothetical protein
VAASPAETKLSHAPSSCWSTDDIHDKDETKILNAYEESLVSTPFFFPDPGDRV